MHKKPMPNLASAFSVLVDRCGYLCYNVYNRITFWEEFLYEIVYT